jgi:hypothetical protein
MFCWKFLFIEVYQHYEASKISTAISRSAKELNYQFLFLSIVPIFIGLIDNFFLYLLGYERLDLHAAPDASAHCPI